MKFEAKTLRTLALVVFSMALFSGFRPVTAAASETESGAVYVMTNQAGGNTIIAFERDESGALTRVQEVATKGLGSGGTDDPLASQGALAINGDGHLLVAVNAGSNDVSVLSIGENGVQFIEKVPSGGIRPTSVAIHHDLVYVLNAGGTANISGFRLDQFGHIMPIPGSVRTLAGGNITAASQVAFRNDGELMLVTEKASGLIDIFEMGSDGLAENQSSRKSNNRTPFGIGFARHGVVLVSEAADNVPAASSVSSYKVGQDGSSLNSVTESLSAGQTAACWVVIPRSGRIAFVSNTTSGTISSYGLNPDGSLLVLEPVAAFLGSDSGLIDMALTRNDEFLYIESSHLGIVTGFRVQDGKLVEVTRQTGLPLSIQGIAAR